MLYEVITVSGASRRKNRLTAACRYHLPPSPKTEKRSPCSTSFRTFMFLPKSSVDGFAPRYPNMVSSDKAMFVSVTTVTWVPTWVFSSTNSVTLALVLVSDSETLVSTPMTLVDFSSASKLLIAVLLASSYNFV